MHRSDIDLPEVDIATGKNAGENKQTNKQTNSKINQFTWKQTIINNKKKKVAVKSVSS